MLAQTQMTASGNGPGQRPYLVRLARFVTHITAPPVLAVPGFFLLANISQSHHPTDHSPAALLATALLFGVVGPILLVAALRLFKIVSDIHIGRQNQRTLPFLMCIFSFAAGTLVMWYIFGWNILAALLGCYTVNTLLVMLINLKWKISVHATGLGGPIAAFCLAVSWAVLPVMLALLALVCWARLYLRAHSLGQVLAGSVLGFSVTLIFFSLLQVPV